MPEYIYNQAMNYVSINQGITSMYPGTYLQYASMYCINEHQLIDYYTSLCYITVHQCICSVYQHTSTLHQCISMYCVNVHQHVINVHQCIHSADIIVLCKHMSMYVSEYIQHITYYVNLHQYICQCTSTYITVYVQCM